MNILPIITIIISSITTVFSILLLISNIFYDKSNSLLHVLHFHFILSTILCGAYLICFSLHLNEIFYHCKIIFVLRNIFFFSTTCCSLCIALISSLILKHYIFSKRTKTIIIAISSFIIWLVPCICIVFVIIYGDNIEYNDKLCSVKKPEVLVTIMVFIARAFEMITLVCIATLIIIICKLDALNIEKISELKKKICWESVQYMIGVVIFLLLYFFSITKEELTEILILLTSIIEIAMIYFFVWQKQQQSAFYKMVCCKKNLVNEISEKTENRNLIKNDDDDNYGKDMGTETEED